MGNGSRLLAVLALLLLAAPGCSDDGPGPTHDGGVDAAADGGGGPAARCTQTGGTVGTQLCCGSTLDFPDTCGVGTCGCSPSASHEVQSCTCASGQCFTQDKGCHAP